MMRDGASIEAFLGRIAFSWRQYPDMRFGQLVGNVVRAGHDRLGRRHGLDDLLTITDAEFVCLLDEWDQEFRRAQADADRHRAERRRKLDPAFEEETRRSVQAWNAWALETFGRIGRDPERIGPFLRYVGLAWADRADLRFGELICRAVPPVEPERPGDPVFRMLLLIEEDLFAKLLDDPRTVTAEDVMDQKWRRGPSLFR